MVIEAGDTCPHCGSKHGYCYYITLKHQIRRWWDGRQFQNIISETIERATIGHCLICGKEVKLTLTGYVRKNQDVREQERVRQ